jgi:hypothetical protein
MSSADADRRSSAPVVVIVVMLALSPLLVLTASCEDTGPSPIANHPDAGPEAEASVPPPDDTGRR